MENDLDQIEAEIKKKAQPKPKIKKSGSSVFKLQEIIKKKSQKHKTQNNQNSS